MVNTLFTNHFQSINLTEFAIPSRSTSDIITRGPDGNYWFTKSNGVCMTTQNGYITEFDFPDEIKVSPTKIIAGPDNNLWISGTNSIRKLSPAGNLARFPIPSQNYVSDLTVGPDGNVWFSETSLSGTEYIGRVTPLGVITEFSYPPILGHAYGLISGPDNYLWFMGYRHIGKITTSGEVTIFEIKSGFPSSLILGLDGNMWFGEYAYSPGESTFIGYIKPSGEISEFQLNTILNDYLHLVAGPDGNVWFTETKSNIVGYITQSDVIKEFPIPNSHVYPDHILVGPDNGLWFTARNRVNMNMGRVNLDGNISFYSTPSWGSFIGNMIRGYDNSLWFTEINSIFIGKITFS